MANPLDNPHHELWQTAEALAGKFGVKSSFQDDGHWYLVPRDNSCGPRFAGPFDGVADAFWYLIQNEAHLTPRAADVCHEVADGRHLWQNDEVGRYCIACGTRG